MSITTLSLYESLLKHDRHCAWWGLDTADPTVDDSGHGHTLTALATPSNAAGLVAHGDGGASGCRDFNGSTGGYFCNGTVMADPDTQPGFLYLQEATSATADIAFTTGTVEANDLLLVALVHPTATATISSAPAGWTQVGSTLNFTAGALAVYKRTPSVQEPPALYTWTWNSTGALYAVLLGYRGANTAVSGLIFDSGQQATASGQFHATTVETYPKYARVLAIYGADMAGTITPATVDANVRVNGGNGDSKIVAVDYPLITSGSTSKSASTSIAAQLGTMLITFGSPDVVAYNSLDTLDEKVSFTCLINADTIVGGDTIVRKHQAWGMHLATGQLKFLYRDGGGVDRTVNGPTLSAGTTYHVVMADDGTNIHWWVNGTHTTAARLGTAGYTTNTNRISIGHYFDGSTTQDFFDGRIDELTIANGPISNQMATAYYTAHNAGTFGTSLGGLTTLPRPKLEIAWPSSPSDEFLVWEDVTSYLRGSPLSITRGRNFELDRIETGRMDFILSSRAREFVMDSALSPFYPNVKPTRAVRWRAQAAVDGVVYPRFFGYLEGWPMRRTASGSDQVAAMTSADVFKTLSLDKVELSTVRQQELSGVRLRAVLGEIDGIVLSVQDGQSEVIGDDLNGQNRLEHAYQVVETDGGVMFASGEGIVTFQDRHYRSISERTVRATYDDRSATFPLIHQEPEIDEARLFTAARVTPASGNTKSVTGDAQSVKDHYTRTKELTTLHALDSDAQAMAEAYANRYAIPRMRIPSVLVNGRGSTTPASMWATVLSHDISHRIKTIERVSGDGSAVSREHFVEGMTETWEPMNLRIAFSVSPADLDGDYWLLGSGELGDASGITSTVLGW